MRLADPSGRVVQGVGLQPLACWDCGFETRWGHGCLSLVSVVCCQVSASGLSLVQRSPTKHGVSECDHEASIIRRPRSTRDCCAKTKKKYVRLWRWWWQSAKDSATKTNATGNRRKTKLVTIQTQCQCVYTVGTSTALRQFLEFRNLKCYVDSRN